MAGRVSQQKLGITQAALSKYLISKAVACMIDAVTLKPVLELKWPNLQNLNLSYFLSY